MGAKQKIVGTTKEITHFYLICLLPENSKYCTLRGERGIHMKQFKDYQEIWPFYLTQHSKRQQEYGTLLVLPLFLFV